MVALLAVLPACGAGSEPASSASSGPSAAQPSASAPTTAPGDPATWVLAPKETLQPTSTTFTALVSRLACNNGVTGQVLAPVIQPGESEIVVTFVVTPQQTGAADCRGNNAVSYEVDLGEPLQDRALVDGQCLEGQAAAQICGDDATRFKP